MVRVAAASVPYSSNLPVFSPMDCSAVSRSLTAIVNALSAAAAALEAAERRSNTDRAALKRLRNDVSHWVLTRQAAMPAAPRSISWADLRDALQLRVMGAVVGPLADGAAEAVLFGAPLQWQDVLMRSATQLASFARTSCCALRAWTNQLECLADRLDSCATALAMERLLACVRNLPGRVRVGRMCEQSAARELDARQVVLMRARQLVAARGAMVLSRRRTLSRLNASLPRALHLAQHAASPAGAGLLPNSFRPID